MAAAREQQENAPPSAKGTERRIKPRTLLFNPEEIGTILSVLWCCKGLNLYRPLIAIFLHVKA